MKVLTVVGARPQFIKASVLSAELKRRGCNETLVHTGQHYDHNMSRVFFEGLTIKEPDFNLEVGSSSHAAQTAVMMERLEPIIGEVDPDWVVVYGDTNTTLAGALVAAKLRVPLAHVEAGLRSYNRNMPEEINRVVADHVSDLNFAPTSKATAQLAQEGIRAGVFQVGDLMVDLVKSVSAALPGRPAVLDRFRLTAGAYGVATVHRAANTDDENALVQILEGLLRLDFPIIFPVHPRTAPLVAKHGSHGRFKRLMVCEPLGYTDMIGLAARARTILTDSGGIQKEALVLGVPCVTLREETEWTETLIDGWNVLAGTNPASIAKYGVRQAPATSPRSFYGDGYTAAHIVDELMRQSGKAIA